MVSVVILTFIMLNVIMLIVSMFTVIKLTVIMLIVTVLILVILSVKGKMTPYDRTTFKWDKKYSKLYKNVFSQKSTFFPLFILCAAVSIEMALMTSNFYALSRSITSSTIKASMRSIILMEQHFFEFSINQLKSHLNIIHQFYNIKSD